jgi:hypothetical protein
MVQHLQQPKFEPGIYRHYKGWSYEALGVACDEEKFTWHVIYKPLYPHEGMPDMWSRPYADFIGEVEVDGKMVKRFQKMQKSLGHHNLPPMPLPPEVDSGI